MERINERNASMDLLRIVSMIFIICHHLIYNGINWGGMIVSDSYVSYPSLFYQLGGVLETIFIVGVNIFYILSGYFRIKLSLKKIIKTVITLYFYVIIINFFGVIEGTLDIKSALKDTLFSIHSYWFLEVYVVLMLVSPFLNCILDYMNMEWKRHFLIVFITIFCGYTFIADSTYLGVARGYSLVFASCLYILGGLLKKSRLSNEIKLWGGNYSISVLTAIFIMLFCINNNYYNIILDYLLAYNNPLIVLESFGLVLIFLKIEIKNTRISLFISYAAMSTMAVYILHSTNAIFTKYRNIPLNYLVSEGKWRCAYFVLLPYALLIFAICVLADKAFEKIFGKLVDNISMSLAKLFTEMIQKISSVLEYHLTE